MSPPLSLTISRTRSSMAWKENLLQGYEGVSLLMSTRIKPDHDVSTSLGHQRASCSHHWWSNNLTMEDGARLHLKGKLV